MAITYVFAGIATGNYPNVTAGQTRVLN